MHAPAENQGKTARSQMDDDDKTNGDVSFDPSRELSVDSKVEVYDMPLQSAPMTKKEYL